MNGILCIRKLAYNWDISQGTEAASCSTLEQMGPEVLQYEARLAKWLKHRRPLACYLLFMGSDLLSYFSNRRHP